MCSECERLPGEVEPRGSASVALQLHGPYALMLVPLWPLRHSLSSLSLCRARALLRLTAAGGCDCGGTSEVDQSSSDTGWAASERGYAETRATREQCATREESPTSVGPSVMLLKQNNFLVAQLLLFLAQLLQCFSFVFLVALRDALISESALRLSNLLLHFVDVSLCLRDVLLEGEERRAGPAVDIAAAAAARCRSGGVGGGGRHDSMHSRRRGGGRRAVGHHGGARLLLLLSLQRRSGASGRTMRRCGPRD